MTAKGSGKAPRVVRFVHSVVLYDRALSRPMQVVEARGEDYDLTFTAYSVTITGKPKTPTEWVDTVVPMSNVRSVDFGTPPRADG